MPKKLIFATLSLITGFFLLYILIRKYFAIKEKDSKEKKALAMKDELGLKKAYINTKFIEKELFNCVECLVKSYYYLSPELVPSSFVSLEFIEGFKKILNREINIGIKKNVHSFLLDKIKVVRQDNSSHFNVASIEIQGIFVVEYDYLHATFKKNIKKSFKQIFIFYNANDTWLLNKINPESIIDELVTDL